MTFNQLLRVSLRSVANAHRRYAIRHRLHRIAIHQEHIRRERANGFEAERVLERERMNLKAELRGL